MFLRSSSMQINYIKCDLFDNNFKEPFYYAHCISADFALGAGIAVQFNRLFHLRSKLRNTYPKYYDWFVYEQKYSEWGDCILESGVLNLITKANYYDKPTRASVREALEAAKRICEDNNIKNICMPKIAAGLDRRPWEETEEDIVDIWENTKMKIYVFTL